MRTTLGRIAVAACCTVTAIAGTSAAARAQTPPSSAPETSAPATEPPTTPPPAGVVVVPGSVTASRGTQAQVTDTLPPPPSTLPPDALPLDSGEGRRLVYSKSQMRTWIVEADNTVTRTYLVSGRRTWNQPTPGTYDVFSKSGYTCNIKKPWICWRFMVRFTKGPDGDNIGFHEIPKNRGVPVQTLAQLGQALSDGCVRQAPVDAEFLWNWAPVGTKVVVLG